MKNQSPENLLTTTSNQETVSVRKSSDSIPVDLLMDIFSLLPAKSIARFRCVSKLWASVLHRPDFTEFFLTKSWSRPRLFFALNVEGKLFFYSSPQPQDLLDEQDSENSCNSDEEEDSCLVACRYHASYPEYVPTDKCTIVNGLALLESYSRTPKLRVICNPATGEFITLPKVLLKPKNLPKEEARSYPDKIEEFHFGYDPIEKQHKVLCMTSSRSDQRPNTHMVLTLESGKRSWRRIDDHKFHFVENARTRGEVCINGVLFFGSDINLSTVIVCFDVRSEKFGLINTVEEMSLSGGYYLRSLTLFNYKGKLGIHSWDNEYDIVFWVLEDAGNHRWSQHIYELSDFLDKDIVEDNCFVGMTSTGDMVWSPYAYNVSDHFYLLFYNLERKTLTRVNVKGLKEFKEYEPYYITLHTFLDYAENIIKNDTWSSQLKLPRKIDASRKKKAPTKEEIIEVSVPTSNRFGILG